MKKGIGIVLVCLMCAFAAVALAAQDTDVVSFPDTLLEKVVRETIGKPEGNITVGDVKNVTYLDFGHDTKEGLPKEDLVSDLGGLEYFTGLDTLAAYNNLITDITPLAGLTNLRTIDLGGNNISDLSPLAGHVYTELFLWGNEIRDLSPLASVTGLDGLYLSDNLITDVSPLAELTSLTRLNLFNNLIWDFSPLAKVCEGLTSMEFDPATPQVGYPIDDPYKPIEFADPVLEAKICAALGLPEGGVTELAAAKVTDLSLSNDTAVGLPDDQYITDLGGLEYFGNLSYLSLYNNRIADISALAGMADLRYLDLGGNSISDLSPLAGHEINVLELWGNQIVDLTPLASVTGLEGLSLHVNQIEDVSALAGLTGLKRLNLSGNPVTDFSPLAELYPNLEEKDFEYYEMLEAKSPKKAIKFADKALKNRLLTILGKKKGKDITQGEAAQITELDLSNSWDGSSPEENIITMLGGIEYFINLRTLNLGCNNLTDISALSSLTALKKQDLYGNAVSDLSPLSQMTWLKELSLYGNPITDIAPLAALTNLTGLNMSGIAMEDIGALSGMTQMDNLYLDNCGITDISALSGMTQMYSLDLSGNAITDLSPLSGMTGIRYLSLNDNRFTDIGALSGMTNLQKLNLADNAITDYSPIEAIYPNLTEKDFEYGQVFTGAYRAPEKPDEVVTFSDPQLEQRIRDALKRPEGDITAADCADVTELYMGTRWSENLTGDDFIGNIDGLQYFVNLKKLDLSINSISDVGPLAGLAGLNELTLNGNHIADVSALAGLTNLYLLRLNDNAISDIGSLAGMTGLKYLDISNNMIADLSPLGSLTSLSSLLLAGNPITDYTPIEAIYPGLKEKNFEYGETFAVTYKPTDPEAAVVFADPVLEKRVRDAMGIPEGDITEKLASTVTEFWFNNEWQETYPEGSQIADLGGIEYFLNLTSLDISFNLVTDLSPLANLKNLQNLKAFGDQITDVSPLAGLTSLTSLNVGGNQIADISPLSNLTKLTTLMLDGNPIADYGPISDLYPRLTETDFQVSDD